MAFIQWCVQWYVWPAGYCVEVNVDSAVLVSELCVNS
jgi:hypothetical protein